MSEGRNPIQAVDALNGFAPEALRTDATVERFALVRDFLRAEAEREVPDIWLARAGALALGGENAPARTILATLLSSPGSLAMGRRGVAAPHALTYQADSYLVQMLVEGTADGRKSRITGQVSEEPEADYLGVPPVIVAEDEGKVLAAALASDLGEFDLQFAPRLRLNLRIAMLNGKEMIVVPVGYDAGSPESLQ